MIHWGVLGWLHVGYMFSRGRFALLPCMCWCMHVHNITPWQEVENKVSGCLQVFRKVYFPRHYLTIDADQWQHNLVCACFIHAEHSNHGVWCPFQVLLSPYSWYPLLSLGCYTSSSWDQCIIKKRSYVEEYFESKILLKEQESFENLHSSAFHSSLSLWLLQSQSNVTSKKTLALQTSAKFSSPKRDQDSEGDWGCCIKQGKHGCHLFIIPLSKKISRQNCNADWVMRHPYLKLSLLCFF